MRIATLQTSSGPRVVGVQGEIDAGGRFVDLAQADRVLAASLEAILALPDWPERTRRAMEDALSAGRFVSGTLLAPLTKPGKVICVGLNYRDHAKESNSPIPAEPIIFSKFSSAVIGPGAAIVLPRASQKVDYEAELVAVIGKRGKNIPASLAREHLAGFMNGNDVSARDWQLEKPGKQWLLGKTPDTFAPMGPYLVTLDEAPQASDRAVRLVLNGRTMQDSSTSELIFNIEQLIEHISKMVTLEPGDVIFTGTPPGVGMARTPPVFLKPGDVVDVQITGLGRLSNPVIAE